MTFTLTVSATDWSAVGATPSHGYLELGLLNPDLSAPIITTAKRWTVTLDETGTGSWELPTIPAGNALVLQSRVSGVWQGRKFYFGDPGAGSHSLSELIGSWQVDPKTLEPTEEALAGWTAAVATAGASASAASASAGFAQDAQVAAEVASGVSATSAANAGTSEFNAAQSASSAADSADVASAAATSAATSAADVTTGLASKAPLASPTFTGTVSGITKAMVGLGNVDDTTDLNKPISTATQIALDTKVSVTNNGDGTATFN